MNKCFTLACSSWWLCFDVTSMRRNIILMTTDSWTAIHALNAMFIYMKGYGSMRPAPTIHEIIKAVMKAM